MKNLFLIAVLFCSFTCVKAQTVDLSNLPEQTKQEILQKAQQANASSITPEAVSKWADVGKAVGVAIGATARELNVEVNAFASSPVGKFAMFLLAWNFFLSDLFNAACYASLFLFSILFLKRVYDRRFNIVYEKVPYLFGLFTVRKVLERKQVQGWESDAYWFLYAVSLLLTVVSFIALLSSLAN